MKIETLNAKSFALNGYPTSKVYELRKGSGDTVSLVNVYSGEALYANVPLGGVTIDGESFDEVIDLMNAFEAFKGNFNSGGETPAPSAEAFETISLKIGSSENGGIVISELYNPKGYEVTASEPDPGFIAVFAKGGTITANKKIIANLSSGFYMNEYDPASRRFVACFGNTSILDGVPVARAFLSVVDAAGIEAYIDNGVFLTILIEK